MNKLQTGDFTSVAVNCLDILWQTKTVLFNKNVINDMNFSKNTNNNNTNTTTANNNNNFGFEMSYILVVSTQGTVYPYFEPINSFHLQSDNYKYG